MKAAFVIFDRMTALDFVGAFDPLGRLRTMGILPDFEWTVTDDRELLSGFLLVGGPELKEVSMRSFRLYLGERRYLTAAGWVSLALAVSATAASGYFGAEPLTDWLGSGARVVVVGCGLGVWFLAQRLFRLAGFPLVAEVPKEDRARQ